MSEIIQEVPTQAELDRHFSAMGDSVSLIEGYVAGSYGNRVITKNDESKATVDEVTELPANSVIDKQGIQLGVIAQELQQVCPDCVKEESTGVLSVDSDNLTWYLVNAVKQLSAEVESLKAQLNQGA